MEKLDCVVIGAGVVGLAAARALALAGREVVILEEMEGIGTHASSRNSEVIHAGMYYPTGSLKARLCVKGGQDLFRYCDEKGIGHRRVGKLIVAVDDSDLARLGILERQARINGVLEFRMLDSRETLALEPGVRARAALYSPGTGIIDSHGLMTDLLRDAEGHGAILVLESPVVGGRVGNSGVELAIGGREPMTALCRTVVNCAGAGAEKVARALEGFPASSIPKTYLCKGNYFVYPGALPFSRLVYRVPEKVSLGIHFTLDLAGQGKFGPDAMWVRDLDYRVDESREKAFEDAVREFWPDLPPGSLAPGYAGIRTVLRSSQEVPACDFMIQGPADHGVPGLVNLFGIDSPGLTSCMAIGEEVVRKIEN